MPTDSDPNGLPLQKVLRDLVALSAVPSVWVGRESEDIAADLADLLATLLNLDFAFVHLRDSDGGAPAEIARGTAPPVLLERVQKCLDSRHRLSHPEIVPRACAGNGVHGAGIVFPLGINSEIGLVAAACDRPDFPSEIDQLLLSAAASHGATAFKMARIVEQHRRAETALAAGERQLRQAHDELETKVVERTAELRHSETYLAEAERLSHTGSWAVKDLNGERTVVYWSEESYRIFGFDPREGLPTLDAVWQQVHPDDRSRLREEVDAAVRHKRDCLVAYRIVLPDGTVKSVETVNHHVFSTRGELLELMGTIVDVTEREWAETQLAGDKQLLEMIATGRSLRDVLNALCRFVEEAATGCYCGVYPIDWSGPTFQYGVAPSLPASYIDPIKGLPVRCDIAPCGIAALEKKQVVVADIESDGRWVGTPYQAHVVAHGLRAVWSTPIYSLEGSVLGTFCVYQRNPASPLPRLQSLIAQVTHIASIAIERSRAEEALRELESDLAHMNRLSMMGVLAASLAHEVKQPIAAARNNARAALNFLARRLPDLGEAREALGCIVGDADRAGNIIDRIRAHIKKAPPRKDRCDLNEAVTEVVELARSAISKHGISLQMRLAKDLFGVRGDRVQLQQVILNLILNAVEAMSAVDGPRELLISTEQQQSNGVVSVCDSGPGVDPEQRERVFEAFYTTKSNGVGIGLSICRSIVDAHGGRLWIEAGEPRGATFQFAVPSAVNELRSSFQSPHQTREPREGSVQDAAHQ